VSSNNQPVHWDSTCHGTALPWWTCPGEIALRVQRSLFRDSGKKSESTFKDVLYPIAFRVVQDRPPYHDSFCRMLSQTIGTDFETFLLPTDAHNVKKHRVIKTF